MSAIITKWELEAFDSASAREWAVAHWPTGASVWCVEFVAPLH